MVAVTPLQWDSAFFGFPVARLDLTGELPPPSTLRAAVAAAGNRLCYVLTHDTAGDAVAVAMGGLLADRRTELRRPLSPHARGGSDDGDIATHADLPQLRALALQSAQFSRFRTDPRMPPDAWVRLYERWADNSLAGTMADAVLVARINNMVVGMSSVGCRDGIGTIGLLAVDEAARGRGLGMALLERSAAWFADRDCTDASVVTQGDNLAALRLYERAGYHIADVTNVYHFWSPDTA